MTAFKDRRIISKMRWMTLATLLIFLSALTMLFGTYWLLGTKREAERTARERADSSAASIDRLIWSITEGVVSAFGTEAFALKMTDMFDPDANPTWIRISLQEELTALASSSSAIETVLLVDSEQGLAYTLFRDALRLPQRIEPERISIDRMTVLPPRENPIGGQEWSVSVAYPLSRAYGGPMISGEGNRFIIFVLLDSDTLQSLMPDGSTLVSDMGEMIISKGMEEMEGRNLLSHEANLPYSRTRLTAFIDMDSLRLSLLGTAAASLGASLAVIIMLTAALSAALRRYVTMPIRKLQECVIAIEGGDYSSHADFQGSDELGDLRDSISGMASTIEAQIESIREEQSKRTRTEMQMLSEQLTPHFLYNTLECIQQEIQNGNSSSAAEMTRALSLYLRTVLAYGSETISILSEIQHDMAYIRIMNGRFRRDISYQHTVEPGLEREPILKMVLQPFIENSIKHGFGIGDSAAWVQSPEISTSFSSEGKLIRIEISDNGQGFDAARFRSMMLGGLEGEGHIGVRNTYLRLITFYGKENVSVDVSSIPYYRSTIAITLPRLSSE